MTHKAKLQKKLVIQVVHQSWFILLTGTHFLTSQLLMLLINYSHDKSSPIRSRGTESLKTWEDSTVPPSNTFLNGSTCEAIIVWSLLLEATNQGVDATKPTAAFQGGQVTCKFMLGFQWFLVTGMCLNNVACQLQSYILYFTAIFRDLTNKIAWCLLDIKIRAQTSAEKMFQQTFVGPRVCSMFFPFHSFNMDFQAKHMGVWFI